MPRRVLLSRTTATERRWLVVTAFATLLPFLVLLLWAHDNPPTSVEQQLVNTLLLSPDLWGGLVTSINTLGNPQNWVIVVVVLAVLVGLMRGVTAGVFVGATYLVDFVATLAKSYAERVRPDTANAHALFGADSFGFPSGHTARAAALVGALIWTFAPPRWRLPAAIIGAVVGGVVMGYARVAFGVHFPSDALGGLLLGVAWLAITAALI